jgi:hypothetical protein
MDKDTSIPIKDSTRRALKAWAAINATPDTYDAAIKKLLDEAERVAEKKKQEA